MRTPKLTNLLMKCSSCVGVLFWVHRCVHTDNCVVMQCAVSSWMMQIPWCFLTHLSENWAWNALSGHDLVNVADVAGHLFVTFLLFRIYKRTSVKRTTRRGGLLLCLTRALRASTHFHINKNWAVYKQWDYLLQWIKRRDVLSKFAEFD